MQFEMHKPVEKPWHLVQCHTHNGADLGKLLFRESTRRQEAHSVGPNPAAHHAWVMHSWQKGEREGNHIRRRQDACEHGMSSITAGEVDGRPAAEGRRVRNGWGKVLRSPPPTGPIPSTHLSEAVMNAT